MTQKASGPERPAATTKMPPLVLLSLLVSPETPVVAYVPGEKTDLKPSAKVIAFVNQLPDGSSKPTASLSAGTA
jgi:hypothetical protein